MKNDDKLERSGNEPEETELAGRRDFLRGLAKWSAAVIGGVVLGGLVAPEEAKGWVNTRGSWINGHGGGVGWINRGGSWINGGGGWLNARGGGASWINRR